jgi:hypothetical protein
MVKRWQFTLRALFATLTVAGIAVGVWAQRSLNQQQNVRIVTWARFEVIYDLDNATSGADSGLRQQLMRWLGRDWVATPQEIRSRGYSVVDVELLAAISRLPSVRILDLQGYCVDDAALVQVAQLPRLEVLQLDGTEVTDEGLKVLDGCRSLRSLSLERSFVSQAAARSFGDRHPLCRVTTSTTAQPDSLSVKNRRSSQLKSDRCLSEDEQARLDAAKKLLAEEDNSVKWELFKRFTESSSPTQTDDGSEWLRLNIRFQTRDWLRDNAIDELGKLGAAEGIQPLEKVARDPSENESLREKAIRNLSFIADRRIVPILIDLLADESNGVALTARGQLVKVTGVRSVEWDQHSKSEARQNLIAKWRAFWQDHQDVLRPSRAAAMEYHVSGYRRSLDDY